MLNTDCKILLTILANCMNEVFSSSIHLDQAGFMRNRQLKDNRSRVLNIINYVLNLIFLMLFFLDAEKAFDQVDWCCFKYVLMLMVFGPHVLSWMNIIYNRQTAFILLDGKMSSKIRIS